ncbi:sulfotransferase family cytosolic 2B member 1-like isoform X2 [Parambassis ranga]|uniref:Sulfotransferase n=1 Tax=Parambassis ranga TaxID=210632 RepID=A0A6P7IFJ2_9TELE|nr:sulfotransferase family cytosolic 2B member 1-like isoform X2 [Parambassis ranga]
MTEAELYTEYKGVYLSKSMSPPQSLKYFEDFTFRPDDIIIATYPKAGMHWMQHIVGLVMNGGDPTSVDTVHTWKRASWLEQTSMITFSLEERPSPRVFSTHFHHNMMPLSFFDVNPKVIYVMRNPKDVFTSYFHFHEIAPFLVKPGSSSEFLHKFLDGKVQHGSWFDHVKSWLNAENKQHIMYISYEELSADLKASVAKVAEFLEKRLDDEVMEKIAEKCLFNNMKENKIFRSELASQYLDQTKLFRKGVVGDWKNLLAAEEAEHFDAVYTDKMKDVEYTFVWD